MIGKSLREMLLRGMKTIIGILIKDDEGDICRNKGIGVCVPLR